MLQTSLISASDGPDEVTLIIDKICSYAEGDLYGLKIDYEKDFPGRDYYEWDRFHPGYFYVRADKIYLMQNRNQNLSEKYMTREMKKCCQSL